MNNYQNLIAWQKGFIVAKYTYQLTETLPKNQQFRLCDQMERSAVSIISNIAEGSRRTSAEWKNYLRISLGSASELETQVLLAKELQIGDSKICDKILILIDEISRLLYCYEKNLKLTH